jgi:hypothetical protein
VIHERFLIPFLHDLAMERQALVSSSDPGAGKRRGDIVKPTLRTPIPGAVNLRPCACATCATIKGPVSSGGQKISLVQIRFRADEWKGRGMGL